MMSNNKLIIASAGSGKTTLLAKQALEAKGRVLITTFTIANELEIKKKIVKLNGFIPSHVTVQTWFSFLLQHGVKPYQGQLFPKRIKGMILINGQSARFISEEKDFEKHYFTKDRHIYSDKLAKFVVKCNAASKGAVVDRLARIYSNIFIDEVQDMAGYDLDFLKLLLKSTSFILLVGDPRQGTYSTNNSSRGKKFRRGEIVHFFEDLSIGVETDDTMLTTNWRCNEGICNLADKLFPEFKPTKSGNCEITGHDGVFFVRWKDLKMYLEKFTPFQLRYDSRTITDPTYDVSNFGESKGQEHFRVLIYSPKTVIKWLEGKSNTLAPTTRSKFYVALTRAFHSVASVYDFKSETSIEGIVNYNI